MSSPILIYKWHKARFIGRALEDLVKKWIDEKDGEVEWSLNLTDTTDGVDFIVKFRKKPKPTYIECNNHAEHYETKPRHLQDLEGKYKGTDGDSILIAAGNFTKKSMEYLKTLRIKLWHLSSQVSLINRISSFKQIAHYMISYVQSFKADLSFFYFVVRAFSCLERGIVKVSEFFGGQYLKVLSKGTGCCLLEVS